MASNTTLNAGSAGDVIATKERTHDGDAAKVQVVTLAGVTGTEGSYTFGDINGDATNGLDVDVTRLPTLPAGDNNIGNVDLASAIPAGDNNIGNVDIVTVPADPFGTNADAASATGSISGKLRAIAETGIPITGTVTVGSHAVTNAGTFVVQENGAVLTALQLIDNPVVVDDAAFTPGSTSVMMAGFEFDDTTPDTVNEGDAGAGRMSANRCQYVNIRDNAGNERGLNIDASGFLTANINGTVTVGSHAVTNAGTFATQIDGAALTALQLIDNLVLAEDAAHQTGDPGIQMLAVRQNSQSDFGADGDYVPLSIADDGGLRVAIVSGAGSGGTAAADDADFVDGTTSGTPIMGVYESTPTTVTDGDMGMVGITVNREMKVSIADGGIQGVVEDAAASGGEEGVLAMAVRRDTASSGVGTDGDFANLAVDANGRLHVIEPSLAAAAASLAVIDDWDESDRAKVNPIVGQAGVAAGAGAVGATVQRVTLASDDPGVALLGTMDADTGAIMTAVQIMDDWDESDRAKANIIVGQAGITAGAGAVAANTPRVTHASDDPVTTALQIIDNPVLVDDAAFTPGTSSVMMAGFEADEASTDSVDEGDAGAARMTLDRKQIVTPQPHTSGGLLIFRSLDLDESEEEVKATAGQVYGGWVCNTHTATLYLKFYNATAANVTVGTTTPVITIPIPGNSADDIAAVLGAGGMGIQFDTAITVAVTTGLADNDTGAPGANAFIANIFYK